MTEIRTLKELIETHAGGVIGGWDNLQAVIPGGSSMPLIPKETCETLTMDFDSLMAQKSGLGTAGIVVINKDQDIIKCMARIARFYKHESCGQCTPCREGHVQIVNLLKKFVNYTATHKDYQSLASLASVIHETTLCGLGQTSPTSILSTMEFFKEDYIERMRLSSEGGRNNG